MRGVFSILFLCSTLLSVAQSEFFIADFTSKDSSKVKAGVWVEQSFNSNVINNSVLFNVALKNGPTYQSMQNMKPRLTNSNSAGYIGTERLFASFDINNNKDSVITNGWVSVYTDRQVSARFGEDALRLIAFGNRELAGEKAMIDNLSLLLQQTTHLQFGYTIEKNQSVLGIAPSLVIGNKYLNLESEGGFLYTSPIGDSLYAEAAGYMSQSDTSSLLVFDPNGVGAALSFFYTVNFDLFKKNEYQGKLTAEVNNLGFVVWNKNTLTYHIDGNYAWGGFKAPNLFDLNDSIIDLQRPNDVQTSFIDRIEFGTRNQILPFTLSLRYQEQYNEKVFLTFFLQQRFFSQALPFLGMNQEIRMNKTEKKTAVMLNFFESVGGYNLIGLGTGISVINKQIGLRLGTRNLIGLTNPEYFSGFNVHLGFQYKFY